MPTCLGLYVEKNLIKYAKVSKEREATKVEAFGVKFYDKLGEAIDQIISETYSYKIPISINLSDEMYNYFEMFSMLNDKDMKKAIQTEFDLLCDEKKFNKNAIESRYILTNDLDDRDKTKVLHVSINKTELARKSQELDGYKLTTITALPLDMPNLLDLMPNENAIIINMEEKTTITTIASGQINRVDTIEQGSKDILDSINKKENSYAKAYEICKNTTIYTTEGLQENASEYLEEIMPVIYTIVTEAKKIVEENQISVEKVYITGTLAVINNIDLYFQEYFSNQTCEILKPYFLPNTLTAINIKEYMEVNSAIALALQGLGEGPKQTNFKSAKLSENFGKGKRKRGNEKINLKEMIKKGLSGALDPTEFWLLRVCGGLLLVVLIYGISSSLLANQIKAKYEEAESAYKATQSEIATVESDIDRVKNLTNNYDKLKQNLIDLNEKLAERFRSKNAIPNLLNKVMFAIPNGVQITSIENTTDKHIVITAQSEKYEQLGLFIGTIKQSTILTNVTSDSGIKQDSLVKVTIEGDLP